MSLLRRSAASLFRVASMAVFMLILPFLYLAEPFHRFRIGELIDDRIGHLAINTLVFVRQQELSATPNSTYLFVASHPANDQLLKLWKRRLNIVQSLWLRRAYQGFAPLLKLTRFHQPLHYRSMEHEEMTVTEPLLLFSADEEERGREGLRRMGIGAEDWFVCVHARDPSYTAKRTGFGEQQANDLEVRNCSIENYRKAMRWIADQGGFALRMGAIVEAPLTEDHPRIIDYATEYRDDFMDIYLSAKCRFFLGSLCGFLHVPMLFGVPAAAANAVPFCYAGHGLLTTYIPKMLKREDENGFMTFTEARDIGLYEIQPGVDVGWYKRTYYDERGLELIESDPDDILDLCKDMMEQNFASDPEQPASRAQEAYARLYAGTLSENPYMGRIGPRFAEKYKDLIVTEAE